MADNLTWAERTAKAIANQARDEADNGVTPDLYDAVLSALEASREMGNVKLKVALARCYEILRQTEHEVNNEIDPTLPAKDFLDSIFNLL